METYRRRLNDFERELIWVTLCEWRHRKVSWLMNTYGSIPTALRNILEMSERGQVIEFYSGDRFEGILVFDVGVPFWSNKTIVSEIFVLAMPYSKGLQREAIKGLKQIAKEYEAVLITAGNIFQDNNNLIGNGYKKQGFQQSCSTYVQEVT